MDVFSLAMFDIRDFDRCCCCEKKRQIQIELSEWQRRDFGGVEWGVFFAPSNCFRSALLFSDQMFVDDADDEAFEKSKSGTSDEREPYNFGRPRPPFMLISRSEAR